MNFLLFNTTYFLSSKSKEEIKSLILKNSSIPRFHIKHFFIRPYHEDKLLCRFKDYSFRLTLFKYYSREYKIVITGNISETKDSTLVKIKARASYLSISILFFFGIPLSICILHGLYTGRYFSSILCAVSLITIYLINYLLFKYESMRLIQVLSRLLNNQKPFVSNSISSKPCYIKP